MIQIYAATNGFLDRLKVERVTEFLAELTERVHAQAAGTREKIRGGDWSEGTQKEVHDIVEEFASDFGYDLDEEGQPLDESVPPPVESRDVAASQNGNGEAEDEQGAAREETTAAA